MPLKILFNLEKIVGKPVKGNKVVSKRTNKTDEAFGILWKIKLI